MGNLKVKFAGITVCLVGHPWNRKVHGPPYVTLYDEDDRQIGAPDLREMKNLRKWLDICISAEEEFRKPTARKGMKANG